MRKNESEELQVVKPVMNFEWKLPVKIKEQIETGIEMRVCDESNSSILFDVELLGFDAGSTQTQVRHVDWLVKYRKRMLGRGYW